MNARKNISNRARIIERRGNTIVLVIGILVLLVIIATAFVVRTQAGRTTAGAVNAVGQRNDSQREIADDLAGELTVPLFTRPVNVPALGTPTNLLVGSNAVRLPAGVNALRYYGDDRDVDGNGRPDYPYNTPAFAVVPFTNWPDVGTLANNGGSPVFGTWPGGNGAAADWPAGNGNPNAVIGPGSPLRGEWNPLGNPGDGDFRALRDLEPLRWDTNNDGIPDAFSHWRHMTNISRPDNGWRIVFDISDIGDSNNDGYGRLVTDLNVPVEQFLAIPHNYLNSATGDTNLAALGLNNFVNNWGNWLGVSPTGIGGYIGAYRDPALIPPNLLRLRDLDADGVILEAGERPQDEFAGPGALAAYPAGAPRWYVGRVLTDTDGDGYTDSFWFLAPSPVQAGVRTIVGVSVVDNQGMLNGDVATRFLRSDPTGVPQKTRGLTPTDLALVGQLRAIASGNFNVGLYDTWNNWFDATPILTPPNSNYPMDETLYWTRHLQQVGLTNAAGAALVTPNTATRLDYWRRAASHPLSSDPTSFYTPYGLSDELELRMYAGQNYPWILSRLEFSVGADQNNTILRSGLGAEESSEFIDQLFNRQYVRDIRHRMTTYNGARNDFAPQWLWVYGPNKDHDGNGIVNALDLDLNRDGFVNLLDQNLFNAGARKFDLRIPYDQPGYAVFLPGEWDGNPGFEFTTNDRIVNTALPPKFWPIGVALRDHISTALIDAFDNLPGNRGTYYGNAVADVDRTLELAAAYAANIAQWRDRETPAVANDVTSHELSRLNEAVPVQAGPTVASPTARFMGMEAQPFLAEAYVGHIYSDPFAAPIPPVDGAGNPYTNAGQHVVLERDDSRSTVVAVQIANPYSRPINLDDPDAQFQVRVFGQEFDLAGLGALPPASEDLPGTIVLFAIKDNINGTGAPDSLVDRWRDFLDIDGVAGNWTNLPPNTQVIRVDTSRWDIDSRSAYDTSNDPAVEIRRRDPVTAQWVTIDRFDNLTSRRFGDAVNSMSASRPPDDPGLPPSTYVHGDPAGQPYPGFNIGIDGSGFDHWTQWVRATRAWGVDVDNDGEYDFNEMNPRFVFGDYAVCTAAGDAADITDIANTATFIYGGNRYKFTSDPDTPWFTRPYTREQPLPAAAGQNEIVTTRKPTFFDFNHGEIAGPAPAPGTADPAWPNWSFPNKGWYGQKGVGTPDDPVVSPPIAPATVGDRAYRTPFAFQMLQKDDDFEQVGELLNVFLFGHKLEFTNNTTTGTFTGVTTTTFSEYLSQPQESLTGYQDPKLRYRVNRLMLRPTSNGGTVGEYVGVGDPTVVDDPRHAVPDLPAGVRLLEAFVCDGFGCAPLFDLNSSGSTVDEAEGRTLYNAKGFDNSATPGLININTAPLEVIRCLPHMMRTVHETGLSPNGSQQYYSNAGLPLVTTAPNAQATLPRTMVPEAIEQARENANGDSASPYPTGVIGGPNYETGVKPRGFSTIGEVAGLNQSAQYVIGYVDRPASNINDRIYNEQWRVDLDVAGMPLAAGAVLPPKPFLDLPGAGADQASMRLSVDRQDVWDPFAATAGTQRPDYIAGDAEEANLLFAGISNLITTRSDVFTVYFKVRTFRQNTSVSPPRWDATNPEYIVDDSRYVMLVDRSGVNHPGDQPRILYMEKLPN